MGTNFCLRVFVLLLAAWPVYATAADRYVSPTGVDINDCTNTGLPCATIQYAVDQAGNSDTVKVSYGKYAENIEVTSAISALTIQGGWNKDFSSFSDDPGLTLIEGQSGSVINVWEKNSQNIDVTIEAFTINNGNAQYGGGVRVFSIDGGSTAATIKNNIIAGNQATEGGGISISSNNGTTTVGLANNVIKTNTAQSGGGISVDSQKKGIIEVLAVNNMIVDNKSTIGDSGHGAFVSADDSTTSLVFLNTTITGNVDSGSGTGLFIRSYRNGTTTVNFRNSIVWGNENSRTDSYDMLIYEDDSFGDSTLVVSAANSNIGDVSQLSGSYILKGGVISQDPVFADPSEGNYRLKSGSPAIDAAVCGMLTFPPDLKYIRIAPYNDYEGDSRPGDSAPMSTCDMGADEFVRMAVPSGTENWTYPATAQPAVRTRPATAKPIGVGNIAGGGPTLSLKIGLTEISGQVDIYLALFAQHLDPENAYLIKPDLSLQVLSAGLVPWKTNTTGGLGESLYGDIPVSGLSAGTYFFLMMITPAGSHSASYLWATSFAVP